MDIEKEIKNKYLEEKEKNVNIISDFRPGKYYNFPFIMIGSCFREKLNKIYFWIEEEDFLKYLNLTKENYDISKKKYYNENINIEINFSIEKILKASYQNKNKKILLIKIFSYSLIMESEDIFTNKIIFHTNSFEIIDYDYTYKDYLLKDKSYTYFVLYPSIFSNKDRKVYLIEKEKVDFEIFKEYHFDYEYFEKWKSYKKFFDQTTKQIIFNLIKDKEIMKEITFTDYFNKKTQNKIKYLVLSKNINNF